MHEKQKFYLRQSVIDLQTKLQEMQMERDAMADIRLGSVTEIILELYSLQHQTTCMIMSFVNVIFSLLFIS